MRDENGELNTSSLLSNNKVAEAVSSTLPTLSSTLESDRDSGVAIELGSLDTASSTLTPLICFLIHFLSA
jgi:hypothetical protein